MQVEMVHEIRAALRDAATAALRPRRAIIVDAERSSSRTLTSDLAQLGCAAHIVSDVAELRAELVRQADPPDLIAAEYRLAGKRLEDLLAAVPQPLWPRLVIVTA